MDTYILERTNYNFNLLNAFKANKTLGTSVIYRPIHLPLVGGGGERWHWTVNYIESWLSKYAHN